MTASFLDNQQFFVHVQEITRKASLLSQEVVANCCDYFTILSRACTNLKADKLRDTSGESMCCMQRARGVLIS